MLIVILSQNFEDHIMGCVSVVWFNLIGRCVEGSTESGEPRAHWVNSMIKYVCCIVKRRTERV
jgi:hypothetical protein